MPSCSAFLKVTMTAQSCSGVVDEIADQLAQRRRERIELEAAYQALARAILADATSQPRQNACSNMFGCWHSVRGASNSRMSLPA